MLGFCEIRWRQFVLGIIPMQDGWAGGGAARPAFTDAEDDDF